MASPIKAIRAKCIDCSGGSMIEVRLCTVFTCPLWEWRMNKRPSTLKKRQPELLDKDAVLAMAKERSIRENGSDEPEQKTA